MIHLMVLALIFMAFVGAIGFSFMNMTHSTNMLYSTQSDKDITSKWVIALENDRVEDPTTGRLIAPFGLNLEQDYNGNGISDISFHVLPDGYGLPKVNAFGRYYVYCPIGESIGGVGYESATVKTGKIEGDLSTYNVSLLTVNGKKYVAESNLNIDSSINKKSISALILSPYSKDSNAPSCSEVKLTDGIYTVPGAIVTAISSEQASNDKITKTIPLLSGNAQDLSAMSSAWKMGSAIQYNIMIDPDTFSVSGDIDFCFSKDIYPRKVYLNGSFDGSNISQLTSASSAKIKLCNASLYVKDLSLDGIYIDALNSTIYVEDSNINDMNAVNSEFVVNGTVNMTAGIYDNVLSVSSGKVNVKDSTLNFRVKNNNGRVVSLDGSKLDINSSSVNVITSGATDNLKSAIFIDESSSVAIKKSTLNISTKANYSPIVNQGKMDIIGSDINISKSKYAITLKNGGQLGLSESTDLSLTGVNVTAIVDESGLGVYGDNANITSETCWTGLLFSDSISNTSGTSESVNNKITTNRSNWNCNQ
ncbi:hypothetical protein RGL65_001508 [Vibrio parahaemolyticus]|nr:hypothetical protein [Vibrio parahaemolyticus]